VKGLRQHRWAHSTHRFEKDNEKERVMALRTHPAGPPAAAVQPSPGGVGRSTSKAAEAVSDALRREDSVHLTARRRVALLQTISTAALSVVGLYQFGLLRKVPEPPLPGLGADAVDASGEAYALGHTPDSTLGILSGAVTLALAGMGGPRRASEQRLIPLALFAKTLLDAANGAYLTAEQLTKHKKVCAYCTVSAVAGAASVPAAWPEARAAVKAVRAR
jgi:uncharacterized membrane protein